MNEVVDPRSVPNICLSNGTSMPCIGMGTFASDHHTPGEVAAAVAGALDCGYRMFDCAACYGNEAEIGEVLEDAILAGKACREDLYITSKVWNDRHGEGETLAACRKSLQDLRLGYLDLYFVHWPFANYHAPGCDGDARNPESKPFRTEDFMVCWRQCEQLVEEGLVRSIGMSNMTIPKLEAVLPLCKIRPVAIEMELHPCFQQPDLFDYCVAHGIQPVGFCPLGSPNRPERDRANDDLVDTEMPEIVEIARRHGIPPALVCLKWAVQRGQVPIPFSVKEKNYRSNLRCVTEDPLTAEEMQAIAGTDRNNRLIKGQVFLWIGARGWEDLWDPNGTITH